MSTSSDLEAKQGSTDLPVKAVSPPPQDDSNNRITVPDGGYGWFVVVAYFCYNFSQWGANAGYAVYLARYLDTNQFVGAGKLDYAAIGGLAFGSGLFFGPGIAWLVHVTSAQIVIAIGLVLQCASLLLAAFSVKLWQLYLTQGLMISFGLASICIPSMTLLPQWFRKKRNIAMGIGSGGSGLGGIIFNLGMEKIMDEKSVKWALITQCIICTVLNCFALSLTRTRVREIRASSTKEPKYRVFDQQVVSSLGYWLIVAYVSFTMMGYVVLLYSMSAFTVSLGYSQSQGSIVSCMISVGAFFGRPTMGFIADIYGPVTISIAAHLMVAIFSLAMWIPCRNFATALIFSLIVGLFMGTIWSVLAPIATRVVGLHKMSVCLGMIWIFLSACGITAPIIGLELRDTNATSGNDYIKTAIFTGMMYFGSALALWFLRGLLVARDELAIEAQTGFDDGELHLRISPKQWAAGLFKFRQLPRLV
ncbi:LANO_0D02718g1_1 [Lachancea nothofagi CBS 11611]|uniref:LANO_0D02718g1_1 n=1 Tax=Lachancea nothofagi CBS 11611 TaxID=1266666 RepID=A0A1G4JEM5_9SACH|nr:LANO_0D02718g1_1 [Lachancea nothofagi CBS 11611]